MRNIINRVVIFVLLITGLVIFSHSIIPHDHHYNISTEVYHQSHEEHENSDNEPIHCHYFNDIVINKASFASKSKLQALSIAILFIYNLNIDFDNAKSIEVTEDNTSFFVELQAHIKISPTRGSPLLYLS